MTREELEKKIEDKVLKGEMHTGLYDTGVCYVDVYLDGDDGDTVKFKWHEHINHLDEFIGE